MGVAVAAASPCYELLQIFRSGGNELSINNVAVSFVEFFGKFPFINHKHMQIKILFFKYFCSDPC